MLGRLQPGRLPGVAPPNERVSTGTEMVPLSTPRRSDQYGVGSPNPWAGNDSRICLTLAFVRMLPFRWEHNRKGCISRVGSG
ncbi:hypothetical protein GN956_G26027 [Arapaima gigas]